MKILKENKSNQQLKTNNMHHSRCYRSEHISQLNRDKYKNKQRQAQGHILTHKELLMLST